MTWHDAMGSLASKNVSTRGPAALPTSSSGARCGRENSGCAEILSHPRYWTAFPLVIVAEEHFILRRLGGYNLDDWDTPSRPPLGLAGILAGVAGAVVGIRLAYRYDRCAVRHHFPIF
ncbi:hypothetical protein GGX14DRAFT_646496 [Mycena pura]|uniref:Uncharacterized protein n=1 Tax=Mycena pura TaxID=153505 RepID=A0AAD6V7A7_9AGAR|nr:hypothetical protein GGX14DRAFT_646496 [Mycena pura]